MWHSSHTGDLKGGEMAVLSAGVAPDSDEYGGDQLRHYAAGVGRGTRLWSRCQKRLLSHCPVGIEVCHAGK